MDKLNSSGGIYVSVNILGHSRNTSMYSVIYFTVGNNATVSTCTILHYSRSLPNTLRKLLYSLSPLQKPPRSSTQYALLILNTIQQIFIKHLCVKCFSRRQGFRTKKKNCCPHPTHSSQGERRNKNNNPGTSLFLNSSY